MKFLKGLGVSILTLILFVSATSILFLLPLRGAVSKQNIKETITKVDIEKLIKENPQVQEDVNEAFSPLYDTAAEYGISKDVVNKILNSDEVKGLMGDFTGNILDYIFTGKDQKIISNLEIDGLVSDALDKINESGYYEFKEEEKEKILGVVKDTVNNYQELIPDTSVFDEALENDPEVKTVIKTARIVISDKLLTCLFIALGISILGLLGLKFKEGKWIKQSAITILTSAITITSGTLLLSSFGNLISDEVSLVTSIINSTLNKSLTLSITTMIIMIFILILYAIIHKSMLKNKKEVT